MSKQELDEKLLHKYFDDVLDGRREHKVNDPRFLPVLKENVRVLENHLNKYKQLYPDQNTDEYDAELYFHKGCIIYYSKETGDGGIVKSILNSFIFTEDPLEYMDKAISLSDSPRYRFFKATMLQRYGHEKAALKELDYILEKWGDDENVYMSVSEFKDRKF